MAYDTLATKESVDKTMAALTANGHLPEFVQTRAEALERIKALIPAGASVMNGASRTLEQVGYVDYLKAGAHGWNNLHEKVFAEKDPAKQAILRKQATICDYYLGSVHAVAETGEVLIASNSGSQLPGIVFNASNMIFVVSTKKIMPSAAAMHERLEKKVVPLEDARMKSVGMGGTYPSKVLVINREQPFMGRKSHIIFVNEDLGF